jgi:hypothetical protein
VIYFVVLALVFVLAGVLDLCALGILLLVGLLLSYTLFSYFLFLSISFYTLRVDTSYLVLGSKIDITFVNLDCEII